MLKNSKRGLRILSTAALMIASSTLFAQPTVKWRYNAVKGSDDQMCSDVATDGAGNSYAAGTFKTGAFFGTHVFANADPGGGYTDGYVVKYSRVSTLNGTPTRLWSVQVMQSGVVSGANERVSAIATYPDGLGGFNTYIVGSYTAAIDLKSDVFTGGPTLTLPAGASGSQSGFIAKCDNEGRFLWASQIDGPGLDTPYDVCVSPDGSGNVAVYVAGSYNLALTTPTGLPLIGSGTAGFILGYKEIGGVLTSPWARGMGSSGSANDSYFSIASAVGGDVVATGQIRGAGTIHINGAWSLNPVPCAGTSDFVAVRYNVAGTLIYAKNGGGNTNTDAGLATAIDMYGNSYVAGYFSGNCTYDTYTKTNLGASGWDYFILKLDAAGGGLWMTSGGTTADGDAIQSIVVNNIANRIYVAGNFKGAMSYNGVSTSLNAYSTSNIDGFMLAADANTGFLLSGGELQFGGSTGDDNGRAIAINAAEDVFIGSSVSSGTANMDWGTSTALFLTNTSSGTYETGLIRWDHSNWPALANDNSCVHKGIGEWFDLSSWQWKISMGGSFNGTVGFPTTPVTTLSSTNSVAGPPSQDAYITTCNTFGDYLSFVQVMNGTGSEMVYDHLTDGVGNNYFTGYGPYVPSVPNEYFDFVGGPNCTLTTGINTGFLGKYSKTGGYLWGVYFKPLAVVPGSSVEAQGIAIDNAGCIYVTGSFSGRVEFGTITGIAPSLATSVSTSDIFVAKYDNAGTIKWVKAFGSSPSGMERGFSISVDNDPTNPAYYVTGEYSTSGSLSFGPSSIGSTVGGTDIFVMKGDASTANLGAGLKGIRYQNDNVNDTAFDVISPNSSECYITGALNGSTQCFTGSVDFSPAFPIWNWTATNTAGPGAATCFGTDLVMGNNGYVYTSGYVTNPGTLTFGSLTEPVNFHGFLVSYSSWSGTPTCLEVYNFTNNINPPPNSPPLPKMTRTHAIALESGVNSPDHGDNVLVGGSKGHDIFTNIAFAHKITTEGCVVSERRPNPVVPYTVSESALYGSLVYPNPLNGTATLEIRTDADFSSTPLTVVITDMTGREVSRINGITTKLIDINAENFSDGLYYYQVMQENKMISNGKMVVHH